MHNPYLQKEDGELWNDLLTGDTKALEALYRRYYALLLNYGLKCISDDEMVRDCIQDLFVKLAKSTHISETKSPRSYLLKSLRNMINDKVSSASYQAESFIFNDEVFSDIMSDDVADSIFGMNDEDVNMKKALAKALSQLTPQQKHILYLRYIKELSHKEVAEIMNMNVQSSMNLLSRSVSKLREIMKSYSLTIFSFYQFIRFFCE